MSEASERLEKKVLQLLAANPGLTQQQIAEMVNRTTRTIGRIVQKNKDVIEEADELLEIAGHLRALQSTEDAALNYVELATNDKNGAVRLGAQQRIDDIRGIVTEKDRMRLKAAPAAQPGPMFIFPPGVSIDVTVNQRTADSASAQDGRQVLDVTPAKPE